MASRQYRLALYDVQGKVIEGARYTHVGEDTPTPGRDPHSGGTLVCRPQQLDA